WTRARPSASRRSQTWVSSDLLSMGVENESPPRVELLVLHLIGAIPVRGGRLAQVAFAEGQVRLRRAILALGEAEERLPGLLESPGAELDEGLLEPARPFQPLRGHLALHAEELVDPDGDLLSLHLDERQVADLEPV